MSKSKLLCWSDRIYFHLKLFYLHQWKYAVFTSWLPGYYGDCPKKNSYLFDSIVGLKYLTTKISWIVDVVVAQFIPACTEEWQMGEVPAKSGSRVLNFSILSPELWVGMMSSFLSVESMLKLFPAKGEGQWNPLKFSCKRHLTFTRGLQWADCPLKWREAFQSAVNKQQSTKGLKLWQYKLHALIPLVLIKPFSKPVDIWHLNQLSQVVHQFFFS